MFLRARPPGIHPHPEADAREGVATHTPGGPRHAVRCADGHGDGEPHGSHREEASPARESPFAHVAHDARGCWVRIVSSLPERHGSTGTDRLPVARYPDGTQKDGEERSEAAEDEP